MKKIILTCLVTTAFVLCTANAWAALVTPNDSHTPNQVYQDINYVFTSAGLPSPGLTSNTDANPYEVTTSDEYWQDVAPASTSASVAVISIGAANTNTLGDFSFGSPSPVTYIAPSETGFTTLGDGSVSNPFPGGVISPAGKFGFALKTVNHNTGLPTIWYSDQALNSDGFDHMLAYYLPQLNGTTFTVNNGSGNQQITLSSQTYLLGWEDQNENVADNDFKDTIFLVSNVMPAPEPMTVALFGLGVIALFGFVWKKRLVLA